MKELLFKLAPRFLKEKYTWIKHVRPICHQMRRTRQKYAVYYILIATPSHGNMGDQAIVYAQRVFLDKLGHADQVVEFTNEQFMLCATKIAEFVLAQDTIIIDGGGNMGSIWPENELKMQGIVSLFPRNHVVIFPNTMYYSTDSASQQLLRKSKEVFNNHMSLAMVARDYSSFVAMQLQYPSALVLYTPDIVLSLNAFDYPAQSRQGILICMRADRERTTNISENIMLDLLDRYSDKIDCGSTLIDRGVTQRNRKTELFGLLNVFGSYELVVTDRLHAMIFCAITGTPCVAIDNISGKVSGVFRWINHLPYISLAQQNTEEILSEAKRLIGKPGSYVPSQEMLSAFSKLEDLFT